MNRKLTFNLFAAFLVILLSSQTLVVKSISMEEESTSKKLKMTVTSNGTDEKNGDVSCTARIIDKVPKAPFRRNKIVLLGDSITQLSFSASLSGWGTHVADVYQRRCDVYNRGMSGYNTDWYLQYLSTEEGHYDVFGTTNMANYKSDGSHGNEESDVKLVTIFFGANDASCPNLNPRHHVPVPRFKANLKSIVDLCRKNFGESLRIILITPPPVHHESRLKFQKDRWGDKATGELERNMDLASKYAAAVGDVAKELDLPSLNLFQSMQDAVPNNNDGEELWSKFLNDGLHLSREGNIFVGQALQKLIDEVYPEISVEPCPHTSYTGNSSSKGGEALFAGNPKGVGPWHDEIDHTDPKKAFDDHQASKAS